MLKHSDQYARFTMMMGEGCPFCASRSYNEHEPGCPVPTLPRVKLTGEWRDGEIGYMPGGIVGETGVVDSFHLHYNIHTSRPEIVIPIKAAKPAPWYDWPETDTLDG